MVKFIARNNYSCSIEKLFSWHKADLALERLTPPWDKIKVTKKHSPNNTYIDSGEILLTQHVFPFVALNWKIMHKNYKENVLFEDFAIKSPFKSWSHKHIFNRLESNKTELIDDIEFTPWLSLNHINNYILSRLKRSFDYRASILSHDLTMLDLNNTDYIIVTGGTGNVGTHLIPHLNSIGYKILMLKYSKNSDNTFNPSHETKNTNLTVIPWNPYSTKVLDLPENISKNIKYLINLSGENVLGLWTKQKKKDIQTSRIAATKSLLEIIEKNKIKLNCSIHSSAIGIYGNETKDGITENSPLGHGFLAETTKKWEIEQNSFNKYSERNINLRIGVVFLFNGGFLKPIKLPLKLGFGVYFGKDQNHISWIGIEDLSRIVSFLLKNKKISGPVNAVSPTPTTNKELFNILSQKFNTKFLIKVPSRVPRLLSKELTDEILLANQKVIPTKLIDSEFRYFTKNVSDALDNTFGF